MSAELQEILALIDQFLPGDNRKLTRRFLNAIVLHRAERGKWPSATEVCRESGLAAHQVSLQHYELQSLRIVPRSYPDLEGLDVVRLCGKLALSPRAARETRAAGDAAEARGREIGARFAASLSRQS